MVMFRLTGDIEFFTALQPRTLLISSRGAAACGVVPSTRRPRPSYWTAAGGFRSGGGGLGFQKGALRPRQALLCGFIIRSRVPTATCRLNGLRFSGDGHATWVITLR
jgi:hypothetical protein